MGRFVGQFELDALVDRSDLFACYRAIEPDDEQYVFLKVARPEAMDDEAVLLAAYVARWRAFASAGIVGMPRIIEIGDDLVFLATEWVRGRPIRDRLGPGLSGSIETVLADSATILAAIHGAGLVHGDVNPGNLLIDEGRARSWLIDPAPLPIDGAAGHRRVTLHPTCAAPELLAGETPGPASDIFSLGRVIAEAADRMGVVAPPLTRWMLLERPSDRPTAAEIRMTLGQFAGRTRPPPPAPDGGATGHSDPDAASLEIPAFLRWQAGGAPAALSPAKPPEPVKTIVASVPRVARQTAPPEPPPIARGRAERRSLMPGFLRRNRPPRTHITYDVVPSAPSIDGDREVRSVLASVPIPAADPATPTVPADFAVMAPSRVATGAHVFVELWIGPSDRRAEMRAEATRNGRMAERAGRSFIDLARDAMITVLLQLPGFDVAQPVERLGWNSDIRNIGFLVGVPAALAPGRYPGRLRLSLGDVPFASIAFDLDVDAAADAGAPIPEPLVLRVRRIMRAFASYSSEDRAEVLRRVQGIRAAGVDVFVDIVGLRAGEAWEPALYREIDAADGLYLFWSASAARSPWVEREWRYALDRRGIDFINPLALEDPRNVAPPPDLAGKHFNDMLLAFIAAADSANVPPSPPHV